jgi:predicted DNA-binding protein with PD1-like motif
MRTIRHPGAPLEPRVLAVPCRARRLQVTFRPGISVLSAVAEALAPLGIESAVVEIRGGAFDPLVYVMPAESDDGEHAAWYSETYAPQGRAEIEALSFTYGRREGEPFLHCHGVWRHADGLRRAGHLMPGEACFAEPVEATIIALSGAILDQLDDSETKFRLFTPVAHEGPDREGGPAVLCRVKPSEEICSAIERTAKQYGIERASLHGVGSLVGCDFVDGQHMASIASELFIREGTVRLVGGEPVAAVNIDNGDINGRIFEGEIERGRNTVCVTFELVIVEQA